MTQIIEAAIDTNPEVGFGRASLARIGERAGISKGPIGYHFAGKDDLIEQVVVDVIEQGKTYMRPLIIDAMSTGSGFLRAYIESNLAFMRERRTYMVAIVEYRLPDALRRADVLARAGLPPAATTDRQPMISTASRQH